jgi:hypothetical protein
LISGLPEIDVDDWKSNTEYHNYSASSSQIQWFWRAVRSYDKEERAKLLQFVTGTSKVPLNGFKELEGMNGFSRFNIHRDYGSKDRLPSSHTCFNRKFTSAPSATAANGKQNLTSPSTRATRRSANRCSRPSRRAASTLDSHEPKAHFLDPPLRYHACMDRALISIFSASASLAHGISFLLFSICLWHGVFHNLRAFEQGGHCFLQSDHIPERVSRASAATKCRSLWHSWDGRGSRIWSECRLEGLASKRLQRIQ